MKMGKNVLKTALGLIKWVVRQFIDGLVADLRDGRQWLKTKVPGAIALFIEKWLGFWYALFLIAVLSLAGTSLIEVAQWSTTVPFLAESFSEGIFRLAIFGFLFTLNIALLLFGVLTVTAVRGLLWIRDVIVVMWKKHTPPYDIESEREDEPQSLSKTSLTEARKRTVSYALWGSIMFMGITSTLLYAEQHYSDQLYTTISNPYLAEVGEILETAFWVINIEGLLTLLLPEVTQPDIVLFIFVFVIPGIWFVLASRNLLYLMETGVRKQITTIQEEGLIGRTTLYIAAPLIYFLITAMLILFEYVV